MDIGVNAIMPLDPGVYLTMIFGAGPVIMACLYGLQVLWRQDIQTILAVGYSGFAGWYYCSVERISLPYF